MATTTTTLEVPAPIKGKFQLALTESKFQAMADRAGQLIFNEDHLEEIKSFLDDIRKAKKKMDETHKDGKEEALTIGKQWDKAKRDAYALIEPIENQVQTQYSKLCQDLQRAREAQQNEINRKKNIKDGIEANALRFANLIAGCTTAAQLTEVERNINLERTYKTKYAEFHAEAVDRFTELNEFSKRQKGIIKNLEEIEEKKKQAEKEGDEETLIKLSEDHDVFSDQIEDNKIRVQETAINQITNDSAPIEVEAILPTVSARRTTWDFELVDQKEAMKKCPELLTVSLDKEKVKTGMKALKDAGVFTGKKETIINGIRYFEKVTF